MMEKTRLDQVYIKGVEVAGFGGRAGNYIWMS